MSYVGWVITGLLVLIIVIIVTQFKMIVYFLIRMHTKQSEKTAQQTADAINALTQAITQANNTTNFFQADVGQAVTGSPVESAPDISMGEQTTFEKEIGTATVTKNKIKGDGNQVSGRDSNSDLSIRLLLGAVVFVFAIICYMLFHNANLLKQSLPEPEIKIERHLETD